MPRRLLFDGALIELGQLPLIAAIIPAGTVAYIKVGGVWMSATPYIKDAGVWKLAQPYFKHTGAWQ